MGDYTGFKCKVKIKEEYRELVEYIQNGRHNWVEAFDKYPYSFILNYMYNERADFIPFGEISSYLDDWLEEYGVIKTNFNGNVWEVMCSMKNYDNTIEEFVKYILSNISEKVYFCKSKYEYSDYEEDLSYLFPRRLLTKK